MSRAQWAWFVAGLVVFAGLGLWAWFLAGKTLDVADKWSSVLSSFGALAGLAVSVLALVLAKSSGSRIVNIGGDAAGVFTVGDNSPIDRDGR